MCSLFRVRVGLQLTLYGTRSSRYTGHRAMNLKFKPTYLMCVMVAVQGPVASGVAVGRGVRSAHATRRGQIP